MDHGLGYDGGAYEYYTCADEFVFREETDFIWPGNFLIACTWATSLDGKMGEDYYGSPYSIDEDDDDNKCEIRQNFGLLGLVVSQMCKVRKRGTRRPLIAPNYSYELTNTISIFLSQNAAMIQAGAGRGADFSKDTMCPQ